jgi:hypothetical protein
VYYNDFFELGVGPMPGDPTENLRVGDVILYYADGPAVVYGTATITGALEGPVLDYRAGPAGRFRSNGTRSFGP